MTRRRGVLLVGGLVAAVGIALVPLAGAASEDQRLMISERNQLTSPTTQQGTWVGAGAVNDAGAANVTFALVADGDGKGLLTGAHVLTGSAGSITVETKAWVRPFPPETRIMAEGTWKIVAATGAYAGLKGRGKVYATADLTTGEITIVRDGSAE